MRGVCVCVRVCVCMCMRPDIVIWDSQVIHIIELTVPFETNAVDAAERKTLHYQDLRESCALRRRSSIITLEVGSRGFLCAEGFQKQYSLLCTKSKSRQKFEVEVIREVIASSYDIWCKRNWCA